MENNNYIIVTFSNRFTKELNIGLKEMGFEIFNASLEMMHQFLESALERVRIIILSNDKEAVIYRSVLELAGCDPFIVVISEEESDNIINGMNIIHLSGNENPRHIASMFAKMVSIQDYNRQKQLEIKLENHISELLKNGNVSPDSLGFYYLKDAMLIYLDTAIKDYNLKDNVYAQIAKKHSATYASIERNIRCTIERSWEDSSDEFRKKYFGTLGIKKLKIPSPKEYIMTIAEHIKRDLKSGNI